MKKLLFILMMSFMFFGISKAQDMVITGVYDGPLSGGTPKGVELYVINDIADASIYGLGSANNGGGSDGEEFTFPNESFTAGDFIYVASEEEQFNNWFGFNPDYTSGAMSINGDDAIELFMNSGVIDVFGDINVDGSGEPWEYMDGWAYRVDGTGPDGSTFVLDNFMYSGPNALDGETSNATAQFPFPVGTYEPTFVADPEPTNYPTNFAAEMSGIKMQISWTDATGDQLPFAYLVLGNDDGSGFTPPVDGTPINDDLNWDDGTIAVNVLYGAESYLLDVDPNTEYHFTIYPYTNIGTEIDYKTDGNAPMVSVTSNDYSVANQETFDSDLGEWTGYNVNGDQVWGWTDYGNPPGCAIMNGYDEGPNPNEDWLISPALDLSNYESINFSFDHARNHATNNGLSVLVSTNYDGSSDPSTNGTWDDLTSLFTFPAEGTWVFNTAGEADVSTYNGTSTYFAFKYVSTVDDCATWEVDNALIYGVISVGVEELQEENISVYPNPATDRVNVTCSEQGQLRVTNLSGQTVWQKTGEKGMNSIDVSTWLPGMYLIQYTSETGNTNTQKLLIR